MHRGVICRGSQDKVRVPKHISSSFPLEGCKCKNTETIKLAAYFYNLCSYTLEVEQPTRQDEALAVKVAVNHWYPHICVCRRLFMTWQSFRVVRGEMDDKPATVVQFSSIQFKNTSFVPGGQFKARGVVSKQVSMSKQVSTWKDKYESRLRFNMCNYQTTGFFWQWTTALE